MEKSQLIENQIIYENKNVISNQITIKSNLEVSIVVLKQNSGELTLEIKLFVKVLVPFDKQ